MIVFKRYRWLFIVLGFVLINLPGGVDAWLSLWEKANNGNLVPDNLRTVDWTGNIAAIDWIAMVPLLGIILLLVVFWQGWKTNASPASQGYLGRIAKLESLVDNMVSRPNLSAALSQPTGNMPGLLISRAHISASGIFVGQSENVSSVGDDGVGQRTITWAHDYANADYHVSITPTAGQFEVVSKSVGGISIRTFKYQDLPADIELDILAIGES